METKHRIHYEDARDMGSVKDESVDLLLTSPPYPMIEMWDDIFAAQSIEVEKALKNADGPLAFESMHCVLDEVWKEAWRVLKPGAVACVNIGDATRTIDDRFSLYTNHSRIQAGLQNLGFCSLPGILWRKQTNAPNKFMGSGMLPPGAYVTLEHEYILVFRKGDKKIFKSEKEKQVRRESAYFWEERNVWFSDVWTDLKGTGQNLFEKETRARSGSFPFELAYRIVNMFSVRNDLVLDPFMGVGTTMFAAMASARNSTGFEIEPGMEKIVSSKLPDVVSIADSKVRERLAGHLDFVENRLKQKRSFKYRNIHYGFPVTTSQEREIVFNPPVSVEKNEKGDCLALHSDRLMEEFVFDCFDECADPKFPENSKRLKTKQLKFVF